MVEWGELPSTARAPRRGIGGRGESLRAEAEALQTRPHAWAKVATRADENKARTLARNISSGKLAPFADAKFEGAVDGCDVWARYIGPA